MKGWQLAQLNTAQARYGMDGPEMADFNARLDPVNALADASPGFVWRLQTDEGNALEYTLFDDPSLLVNMSVWESLEALKAFVRAPLHMEVMKQRARWFDPMQEASMVLWWVPAGHIPDLDEAQERLVYLRAHGPSERAFSFARHFPPPEAMI